MPPDQSLLLYARAYDLVEDHTSLSPLSFICLPFDTDEEPIDTNNILVELKNYPPDHLPSSVEILKDPLSVTKDVGTLLSKTISLRSYKKDEDDKYTEWDSLRLEEPMLSFASISATDKSSFSALKGKVDLSKLAVQEVEVDNDRDEGLLFPTWAWERGNEIMQDVAGDKMTVERGVLEYLRRTVKVPAVDITIVDDDEEVDEFDQNLGMAPTTPPLMPLPCPATPMSPGPLTNLIDKFEPFDITEEGLTSFENEFESILGRDALQVTPTTDRILHSVRQPAQITPSPVKHHFEELHIEAPLTPPFTSPIPNPTSAYSTRGNEFDASAIPHLNCSDQPSKRVKFSDEIEEFILPPSFDPSEDEESEGNNQDLLTKSAMAEFTAEVMEPGAQYFLMKLQQEQLEAKMDNGSHDGLHITLPIIDWQRPVPVWVSGRELAGVLKYNMGEEVMERWDYRKSLDISGLQWNIGRPVKFEEETILPSDEDEWWSANNDLFPIVPLETVIEDEDEQFWKIEAGRGDDAELECMKIPPKMDLDSLVERKKLKGTSLKTSPAKLQLSAFDSKSGLSSFLSLQNRIFEDRTVPESRQNPATPIAAESPTTAPSSTTTSILNHPLDSEKYPPEDPASLFIISASLLTNRTLYRTIKSLCPKSIFIERDFDSSHIQNMFGERDQVPDEPTEEADILVSPLVGIVITNLQTIRQRPLPGKPPFHVISNTTQPKGIRDRIMKTSERYERLVVGVSVDIGVGTEDLALGKADCGIIAGFVGFCEALGNVQVTVMKGVRSIEGIGRWVVDILGVYSKQWKEVGLAVQISERETSWETFLRQAGMNSYAAQAVLTKLSDNDCGLIDFVTIEKESRRVIFEQFVGRKVLDKFEDVVCAQWQFD
ncbi:hypothetical protein AA313_de0202151 [Arthrobotrys entomopaga]|nr:hypothetical protein AA313_de0202151 [Arthrobotrys entomopaga]